MTLHPGDPVRHFGAITNRHFLRYLGRVVSVEGNRVLVERGGVEKGYALDSVTPGITVGTKPYVAPQSKRGGIGFGMTNQVIDPKRVAN